MLRAVGARRGAARVGAAKRLGRVCRALAAVPSTATSNVGDAQARGEDARKQAGAAGTHDAARFSKIRGMRPAYGATHCDGVAALTSEQRELRDHVRTFAATEIYSRADEIEQNGRVPADVWRQLGSLGVLGITAQPAYGGLGLGYTEQCLVMEELSRACASVALSFGAHSNLCINQLVRHGTPEQLERWLPSLVSGEAVGALAMSETGAGSDVLGMQTVATRASGGWRLRGNKMWITNGPHADILIIYARSGGSPSTAAGQKPLYTAFVVEKRHARGLSASQQLDKLGMRGSATCELVLDDVFVPEENVLGGIGRGAYVLMSGLDAERLVLAAGPLGIMQACLDIALPYSVQRRQFGRSIGEFELMQAKFADMYADLGASRAYVYSVAAASDRAKQAGFGESHDSVTLDRKDCAAVILYAAERATKAALQTIQALGGNGYTNDYSCGRLLRDAKLYEIGAGTSEIRRMLIGRQLFKETADLLARDNAGS